MNKKEGLSVMSDELEQKRQEKIANFKLNFSDDIDGEETEISSSSEDDAGTRVCQRK